MKRLIIFIILSSIILSVTILNFPNYVEMTTSSNSHQEPTWTIGINSSINKLNENKSKLSLIVTLTFSDSVTLAYKTIGGNILSIWNDNYHWVPYTASQYVSSNVYQAKGSYISNYSITFNKSTNLHQENFNSHDFVMNLNQSGIYNMNFSPEQDYPSFKANLSIQLEPSIYVTINPESWTSSGPINIASESSSSINPITTDLNFSFFTNIFPFLIVLISYVTRRRKIK